MDSDEEFEQLATSYGLNLVRSGDGNYAKHDTKLAYCFWHRGVTHQWLVQNTPAGTTSAAVRRERIATAALQGFIGLLGNGTETARYAVEAADALIAELEKDSEE